MRRWVSAASTMLGFALAFTQTACDGCGAKTELSATERTKALASAIAEPAPAPSAPPRDGSIGHAANVLPGQGPKRITFDAPRLGIALPILPGQGVGPIRFGATRQTIERLMGVPCDEATETRCLYVGRALDFKLENGVVTEIRISRKGREAKRAPDGSILEYGFFNGAILPDLYFGMQPSAIQEHLGPPLKTEAVTPMGADGFNERQIYDGLTLEYDRWSNDKLVLGAAILTKSATASANTDKILDAMNKKAAEAAERAKQVRPTKEPR
jgi:hypothetical protein